MNLKKIRLSKEKTQTEVAQAVNLTQFTYSNYENGKTEPNIETLINLANYYKVTIDELVGHEVQYLINKIDFTSEQLSLIDKIKSLNGNQCNQISAYIDGVKDGKK
ncbi:MAG: helix-turn-helix transcriptional regulator [Clostridia bacterium]|nr:helix-turn-helix transcriptional regulator [Clostridia bacterium]